MPTAKKAPPMHLWWVRHPECGLAIVEAPNWEQATVEAAAWWDVPWKEISAAPDVRSLSGTNASTSGPERGDITAA